MANEVDMPAVENKQLVDSDTNTSEVQICLYALIENGRASYECVTLVNMKQQPAKQNTAGGKFILPNMQ